LQEPPRPRNPVLESPDLFLVPGHPAALPLDDREFGDAKLHGKLPPRKPSIFPEFPDVLGKGLGIFGVRRVIIQPVQRPGEGIDTRYVFKEVSTMVRARSM